jgi:hypothetical protein
MRSTVFEPQPGAEPANGTENDPRLRAQLAARGSEWMDAVSYWCDYLTIIDIPGSADPGMSEAS